MAENLKCARCLQIAFKVMGLDEISKEVRYRFELWDILK